MELQWDRPTWDNRTQYAPSTFVSTWQRGLQFSENSQAHSLVSMLLLVSVFCLEIDELEECFFLLTVRRWCHGTDTRRRRGARRTVRTLWTLSIYLLLHTICTQLISRALLLCQFLLLFLLGWPSWNWCLLLRLKNSMSCVNAMCDGENSELDKFW